MEKQVFATLEKYKMLDCNGVVIGLSGGADSVALLHLLAEKGVPLFAVHVNHGLRGEEAEADAVFCRMICRRFDVPLEVFTVNSEKVAKEYKLSVEAAGRLLRYDIFKQVAEARGNHKIATGHHKNDVAETVLMQVLRGTGRVRGIPPVRENIIRPLIGVTREEIEEYCARHKLPFRHDSTNDNTDFTRNKVRLETIPMLAEAYNPNLVDTLARLAEISQTEDEFLDKLTPKFPSMQIWIKELNQFDLALKRRSVRHMLKGLANVTLEHIDNIVGLIDKQSGKEVSLPGGNVARRSYDKIVIMGRGKVEDFSVTLPRNEEIYIIQARCWFYLGRVPKKGPHDDVFTLMLDTYKVRDAKVEVRRRKPGDSVYVEGIGTKKISDWLIDSKVPREYRDLLTVVAIDSDVITVVNGIFSDKFNPPEGKSITYLQIWK
ncbi:MAG: tRNA lysidine(34) synthetase TilS [Defluviitaleaceae bacterium]|nr:tRNA lysidine(34) synthetase TilS [Defluviitaleaceae bacterium]